MLKGEKKYAKPAYERLHSQKKKPNGNNHFNLKSLIIALQNEKYEEQPNENIKYTTELSNSMSVSKRLGIDHLLTPSNFRKPVPSKATVNNDNSKLEFKKPTEKNSSKQQSDSNLYKSHISSTKNRMNRERSPNLALKVDKQRPQSMQTKPNKKSKMYLYKRLSTEIDSITSEIKTDCEDELKILTKDHLRIVLVKTGFIGNNISDIREIEQDETMLDKIWTILRGPQNSTVKPSNVKILAGIILGLKEPVIKKNVIESNSQSLLSSKFDNSSIENIGLLNEN